MKKKIFNNSSILFFTNTIYIYYPYGTFRLKLLFFTLIHGGTTPLRHLRFGPSITMNDSILITMLLLTIHLLYRLSDK